MKSKILLELRAAEGGKDSKLLIVDMMNIYFKACKLHDLKCEIKEQLPSLIKL
jgi:protein subunit release factor A